MTYLVLYLYLAGALVAYEASCQYAAGPVLGLLIAGLWPIVVPLGVVISLLRYFTLPSTDDPSNHHQTAFDLRNRQ